MATSTAPESLTRTTSTIPALFLERIGKTPDREAYRYPVGDEWRSLTWRAAGERVKAIAAGLLSLGLGLEDRVGILSGTRFEWVLIDLGILCAGGATTTVYPSSTAEECAYILHDSSSRLVFAEDAGQVAKLRGHKDAMPGAVQGDPARRHGRSRRRRVGDEPGRPRGRWRQAPGGQPRARSRTPRRRSPASTWPR
jgi:long-subunit acyl-CoA synthetase (AMP-forming)